jgi:hypothetical protein
LGKAAMKFLPLLGKALKDDEVIDVLEQAEMEVVYDFDRLHENTPDKYWAESKKDGYQLRFGADQILSTIFLYAAPIDGFTPVTPNDCDVLFFATTDDAEAYGAEHKLRTTKGGADFLGAWRDWVRLEYDSYSVHYQFRDGGLTMVTVTKKK